MQALHLLELTEYNTESIVCTCSMTLWHFLVLLGFKSLLMYSSQPTHAHLFVFDMLGKGGASKLA